MSDEDLLAIVIGNRAPAIAAALHVYVGDVAALSRASPRELAQVPGVGPARAARVAAAFELGRRALQAQAPRELLVGPADVARHLRPRIAGLQQELFFALGLDVRNGLLDIVEVARGSVHAVEVHPREVFRPLLRMAAAGAVVAHNHPTGDARPSEEDLALTRRLREVGTLVGIPIVDHVVLAGSDFCSIAEYAGATL
jgi:DNA repair protein RadC